MDMVINKNECSVKLRDIKENFCDCLEGVRIDELNRLSRLVMETAKSGGRIFICGNGGSGSNADLFAAVLSKALEPEKKAFCAVSLNADLAVITSYAERLGYERVFSAQLEKFAESSDMLVAISGSGNSPNILKAVEAAKRQGLISVGLTGMGGGKLAKAADFSIVVESDVMEQIESVHTVILYSVAAQIAENLKVKESAVLRAVGVR